MSEKKSANGNLTGIVGASFTLGTFLLELVKLQIFWIVFSLRYFIILGIFPATKAVIAFYFQKFKEKENARVLRYDYFCSLAKSDFRISNILGWPLAAIYLFLLADLFINRTYLNNIFIQIAVIILMILDLGTYLFIFPVLIRYRLKTLQYFRQAFFMFLSSPIETIAIVAGIFLCTLIATFLPILLIVILVPMYLLPNAWFAYQAMLKREKQLQH
jgi:uncharacterized membrane protein YesL